MNKNNARSSIKKWEKAVKDIRSAKRGKCPDGYESWDEYFEDVMCGECGYCKEYVAGCHLCPLDDGVCGGHNSILHRLNAACSRNDRKNILRLAETMLRAVKRYSGLEESQ